MASLSARVEDRADSQVRRPTGPAAIAFTSADRSFRGQGLRLQKGSCYGTFTA